LYRRQVTLAKDMFLKKQNHNNLGFFLCIMVIVFLYSKNLFSYETSEDIQDYINNIDNFTSKFVQTDNNSIEEGRLYIKNNIIRLDYDSPKRTIKINDKKGVYIDHSLREEEFFSTKKGLIKIFYDIFLNTNYFKDSEFKKSKNQIVFSKIVSQEDLKIKVYVIFEIMPLVLRKVITKSEDINLTLGFSEHEYNATFEKDFFSFVPIYLDN